MSNPILVGMNDPGQTIDPFDHLRHQSLVLAKRFFVRFLHGRENLHVLGQRLMPFGDSPESLFEGHAPIV
jgi:hypothetical protein